MRTAILAWIFSSCFCPPIEEPTCDEHACSVLCNDITAGQSEFSEPVSDDVCDCECRCCMMPCARDDGCRIWMIPEPCNGRPNHRDGVCSDESD